MMNRRQPIEMALSAKKSTDFKTNLFGIRNSSTSVPVSCPPGYIRRRCEHSTFSFFNRGKARANARQFER
uniref:Uncharacterized protein n=1 Tax=Strigamia maritima TaxID=126957 RepID=T1IP89_STRMM